MRDRLFAMPVFLMRRTNHVARSVELADAFAMTGHFLLRDIYAPRGLAASDARAGFVEAVLKSARRREDQEPVGTRSPQES
jgi:DNA repair protein RecO (recombination protein O)